MSKKLRESVKAVGAFLVLLSIAVILCYMHKDSLALITAVGFTGVFLFIFASLGEEKIESNKQTGKA